MATSQQVYQEIADAIEANGSTKRPTVGWIAGAFKKAHDFSRMEANLKNRGDELNPDIRQTLQNTMILKDIALKHGLIKQENGKYDVTPRGSKFVQDVAKSLHEWDSINKASFKQLRGTVQQAKGEADQEWYQSLPPDEQHIIDIYSRLTLKEYAMLKGLKNSKDSKKKYTNRVDGLQDSDPESYATLRDVGFINSQNLVNDKLLTKFFDTLAKYDYRHLRSFNRNISSRLDRMTADKALVQNQLDRAVDKNSPRSSDSAVRAQEYINGLESKCDKAWIVALADGNGVRCRANFDQMAEDGVVTKSGNERPELTDFGKVVANFIKNGNPDRDEQGPLNSRLTGEDRLRRRGEILQGRKSSFKDFLAR
jgi:hypothetical protein